jgi:hypothetical protein
MTVDIPANFAQATLNYTPLGAGRPMATVIGFNLDEEGSYEALPNVIHQAFEDNLQNRFSTFCTMTGVEVITDLNKAISGLAPVVGGNADAELVANTSILVKMGTNFRGHKFAGRNYWPAMVDETHVGGSGLIDGTYLASLQGDFEAFFGDIQAAGNSPYILHSNKITPPTAVTHVVVDSKVATQRRRLR